MFDIARQLTLHMGEELLDSRARGEACAADCGVRVDIDQLPAFIGGELLAEFDLRFDRNLVLAVGGVAGVKEGSSLTARHRQRAAIRPT